MTACKFCGMEREKNIFQHERMCPKNPERVMPSLKDKTKTKTVKTINEKVKPDDDKTAAKSVTTPPISEAGTGLPASAAEPQKPEQVKELQPEQEKKKSWALEICIAVIAILLVAFWILSYYLIPPTREEQPHE